MEEDPQESTMKLIENAEVILNADKIETGNIGIIGGKKKKKPLEDQQMDDVSSNQEIEHPSSSLLKETSKQYYDPFSKYAGPPRNENIWHYSLFPSTSSKKSNPPGLSLFTTNRENKYSMFSSNNFYYKNQEEEENEEENEKHQMSFEEKSDSEFSEKSFLQNKLNTSKNASEQLEKKENVPSNTNKQNEPDLSSRYFRTFNFPQSNNPFSLSQLLNPKPTGEENTTLKTETIEKEKNLKWTAEAFSGSFENIGAGTVGTGKNPNFYYKFSEGNEEFNTNTGNIPFRPNIPSTENISRKPPPGFKPNK